MTNSTVVTRFLLITAFAAWLFAASAAVLILNLNSLAVFDEGR